MILLIGLGNPGDKYRKTRHNLGMMVVEALAKKHRLKEIKCKRTISYRYPGTINGKKIMLAIPDNFMNLSGESVKKLVNFYKVKPADLWIIHDDLDLPLGKIRVKKGKSSSGGHKGVESVISYLGQNEFNRLKIGIGSNREKGLRAEKYVLQPFSRQEWLTINQTIDKAVDLLEKTI